MATGFNSTDSSRLVYRLPESGPPLLKKILDRRGWVAWDETSKYWNLYWKGSRYRQSEYQSCQSYQRLNHFPSTAMITKKDSLFRLLRTMKGIYGSAYDFFPLTYSVPTEFIKFVRHVQDESEKDEKSTWICKPADLSRGRGIFVFRDLHELSYQSSAIVQRYVPNPWLISGYKFDLRCYVLVRSFTQLTVYFYEEGLARFATSRFDMSSLDNKFSHLTNTSINKFSPFLNSDKDEVGPGCKWTIAQLRSYCEAKNVDFQKLWQRIKNIVILTLLPLAQEVKEHSSSCFELYGFDVLVDENLKPWLLEVNMSPALSVDSQVDIDVKQALLEDIIDLIGLDEQDADQAMRHAEELSSPQPTRRKSVQEKRPSTRGKTQMIQYPESVGKFERIFPVPGTKSNLNCKVGDAAMKELIQKIKKL